MTKAHRSIVVIEAPSNLGLAPSGPGPEPGTKRAPDVLGSLGLYERVNAVEVVRVEPGEYRRERQGVFGIRNADAIVEHAVRLADAVEKVVRANRFALVVGGDCSVLLGSALGLRRVGEFGMIYVDGHKDFYLPEQSATGGVAGFDLAIATGWGPEVLTNIEGRRPYFQPQHVAHLGDRDVEGRRTAAIPEIAKSGIHYRPLEALRSAGIQPSTTSALSAVGSGARRYWIHFDVDALNSEAMPAVDSPQPDGLSWQEAEELLRAAIEGDCVGLQVTIYDPDRDPGLLAGLRLSRLLASRLNAADADRA